MSVKCELLFKLCRRHGWGNPITEEGWVDLALPSSDQAKGRELVEDLKQEPYIAFRRGKGYWMKNDPDSQAQAAYRLKTNCSYSELRIEATLSRFEQAGGFDTYDEENVLATLDDW